MGPFRANEHGGGTGRSDDTLSDRRLRAAALAAHATCHVTTTERDSGRLRFVEVPYALEGRALYALAEPGPLAPWVRDVLRDPEVSVRLGETALPGRAEVLDPGPELERARDLLLAKYDPSASHDLSYWIRSGQPVRIELSGGRGHEPGAGGRES